MGGTGRIVSFVYCFALRIFKVSRGWWLILRIYKSGILLGFGGSNRLVGVLGRFFVRVFWRFDRVL